MSAPATLARPVLLRVGANVKARRLRTDGSYERFPAEGDERFDAQTYFFRAEK